MVFLQVVNKLTKTSLLYNNSPLTDYCLLRQKTRLQIDNQQQSDLTGITKLKIYPRRRSENRYKFEICLLRWKFDEWKSKIFPLLKLRLEMKGEKENERKRKACHDLNFWRHGYERARGCGHGLQVLFSEFHRNIH